MNKEIIKNLRYRFWYKWEKSMPYIFIKYEKESKCFQEWNDLYWIEFELNDSTSYFINDFIVDLQATLYWEKKYCNFWSDMMMLFVEKEGLVYISYNFDEENIIVNVPSEYILKMVKNWSTHIKNWEEKIWIEYEWFHE